MAQTVIGMFDNATDAQQAVEKLVNRGFSRENIDVSSRSATTGTSSGSVTGSSDISSSSAVTSGSGSTGASGDYTSGNFTGSSYAGKGSDALGTNFNSDETRSSSMSGNYSNDDMAGEHKGSAIGNFFRSLFGNDDEADTYSNVANRTGSIVTVHAKTAEEAEDAADILDDAGAVDVNERASQYGYNQSASTGSVTGETGTTGTSIPVIQEELQVGKKTVETGGKRLRSRIVERPVQEDLRLREERVWVERSTVNRPATEADLANFQQKEYELVERAEVPVVAKEARVVEEVSLGKEVDERVETVRDTVRNTEVDVEDIQNTTTNTGTSTGSTGTTGTSGTTGYNSSDNLNP